MYTPSSILGTWFRGMIGIAMIAAAVWLFNLWHRELPEPLPQTTRQADARESIPAPQRQSSSNKLMNWRPGWDRPTGYFAAALLLSLLCVGGGRLSYPLLLRRGADDPTNFRSDRATRLRRPDGTELQIEEFGKVDGPTVVLTHGWGVDSSEWYYVKKQLADEYRIVVWDLPGLGRSTRAANNDYELSRFAHDLQAVVEWTNAPQVILVGHSIGGMTLQTYARLYPAESRVKGLALVHTTYMNPLRTTRSASFYSAIEIPVIVPLLYLTIGLSPLIWLMNLFSYLNGSAHRSAHKQSFSGAETRGQLDFAARYGLQNSPGVLARGMLAMLRFDERQSVRRISYPTTVVAGGRDPITLPEASQYLAANIPRATYVELPKGRHQAHLEFHEAFLGALRSFARACSLGEGNPLATSKSRSSPATEVQGNGELA